MTKPVNYVLEADIKGFFDSVEHAKLMTLLEKRIADRALLRLIGRILKSGIMEEGKYWETETGTPQGGIVSPILANIYLHYALDEWFEREQKKRLRGYASLIRYADDFVICVKYAEEAKEIERALEERFEGYGLRLSKEKTRLVEFGRYAEERTARRGERPGTFDFLGFTHYCDKTRRGGFKVGHKTSKKKFRRGVKAMNEWLKKGRNVMPLKDLWERLAWKLNGHYQYYGISGNSQGIRRYRDIVVRQAYKWLNRRSQRKSWNWESFSRYMERYPLPKPRICHNLYTLSPTRGG